MPLILQVLCCNKRFYPTFQSTPGNTQYCCQEGFECTEATIPDPPKYNQGSSSQGVQNNTGVCNAAQYMCWQGFCYFCWRGNVCGWGPMHGGTPGTAGWTPSTQRWICHDFLQVSSTIHKAGIILPFHRDFPFHPSTHYLYYSFPCVSLTLFLCTFVGSYFPFHVSLSSASHPVLQYLSYSGTPQSLKLLGL